MQEITEHNKMFGEMSMVVLGIGHILKNKVCMVLWCFFLCVWHLWGVSNNLVFPTYPQGIDGSFADVSEWVNKMDTSSATFMQASVETQEVQQKAETAKKELSTILEKVEDAKAKLQKLNEKTEQVGLLINILFRCWNKWCWNKYPNCPLPRAPCR